MEKKTIYAVSIVAVLFLALFTFSLVDIGLLQEIEENQKYIYASEARGISMGEEIQNGDLILVLKKDSPNFDAQVGDVLVYYYEEKGYFVAHRLIKKTETGFYLKGDANPNSEFIEKDYVIGEVLGIAPRNPLGRWTVNYALEN
jgi:signal peptidase I